MTNKTKKILITGPESSGKSTLCNWLSKQLNCPINPEYARAYLEKHGSEYSADDLPIILQHQLKNEAHLVAKNPTYLICDTGPEVVYIWNHVVFQQPQKEISEAFNSMKYDLVLLLYPDLKWEEDPLREIPSVSKRIALFDLYHSLLQPHQPIVIKGTGNKRFQSALEHILDL